LAELPRLSKLITKVPYRLQRRLIVGVRMRISGITISWCADSMQWTRITSSSEQMASECLLWNFATITLVEWLRGWQIRMLKMFKKKWAILIQISLPGLLRFYYPRIKKTWKNRPPVRVIFILPVGCWCDCQRPWLRWIILLCRDFCSILGLEELLACTFSESRNGPNSEMRSPFSIGFGGLASFAVALSDYFLKTQSVDYLSWTQ